MFYKKVGADTPEAKFVWEHPYYLKYSLLANDVETEYLAKNSRRWTMESDMLVCGQSATKRSIMFLRHHACIDGGS